MFGKQFPIKILAMFYLPQHWAFFYNTLFKKIKIIHITVSVTKEVFCHTGIMFSNTKAKCTKMY